MNQQNEATSSMPPAELPAKRKRGRPRKDDSPAQGRTSTVLPGPKVAPPSSDRSDDLVVGQAVSGVVEGSFDAGYFLSVRAGGTDTLLRGVVFQPGRFTPVSEANDVAPHVRMYTRSNVPVPVVNPQSRQHNDRPTHLANPVPLLVPSRFSPGTSFALPKPPSTPVPKSVCSSSTFLKNNNLGISLEKVVHSELSTPQAFPSKLPVESPVSLKEGANANAESGKGMNSDLAASSSVEGSKVGLEASEGLKSDPFLKPAVEKCKAMSNFEALPRLEGPEVGMESSKDMDLDLASKPVVEEPQIVEGPSEDEKEASKDLNFDLTSKEERHVIDVEALTLGVEMEMTKDPKLDLPPNPAVESGKVMHGLESSRSAEPAVNEEASEGLNSNIPPGHGFKPSELAFESEPKIPNLELQLTSVVAEAESSSPKPVNDMIEERPAKVSNCENGKLSRDAMDNRESGTNLNFQPKEEAALPKPRTPAEGTVLPVPGILDSQVPGAPDHTRNTDCNLKDAVSLAESRGHPVVSDTPARNGDCIQN